MCRAGLVNLLVMTGHRTATARKTALVAAGSALGLIAGAAPVGATEDVRTPRLAGPDRFATAVDIAAERVAGADASIETVLLARADDFPDALAGAGLASMVGGISETSAPILLTGRDSLPAATAQALQDFSVRRVVLLGGTDAISAQVEAQLAQDHDVQRVAGANRYATAAEAARMLVANTQGLSELAGQRTVLVASGQDFADALAGGPVAYAGQLPILLTDPDELPAATAAVLDELAPERALLLGGEAALSTAVQAQIEQRGIATRRLGGANRQATAAQIADFALSELGFDGQGVVLARGDAFPDALAGGLQAGRTRAPILLTQSPTQLSEPTRAWLEGHRDTVQVIQVVGGPSAVTAATVQQAEHAAETGSGDGGTEEPFPADTSRDTGTASDDARLNLTDLDFGVHDGYDRVVLGLEGQGSPGWSVRYVETPRAQGSGNPVEVEGDAYLNVNITGVIYPNEPDGQPYEGPEQINPESSGVVQEVEVGGNFEGYRQAFIGLGSRQPFRVFALDNPTRIVIDVQHPTGGDGGGTTPDQTFGVAPQEALTNPVGAMSEFTVFTRYDDRPLTGPVDVVLFPCGNVDATGAGPVVFTDTNGDRRADGIGTSDTGAARIIGVSGIEVATTTVRGTAPADGDLSFHVNAAAADCTVPVVYDDENRDGQLAVDADGRGTEPFGVVKITWG